MLFVFWHTCSTLFTHSVEKLLPRTVYPYACYVTFLLYYITYKVCTGIKKKGIRVYTNINNSYVLTIYFSHVRNALTKSVVNIFKPFKETCQENL